MRYFISCLVILVISCSQGCQRLGTVDDGTVWLEEGIVHGDVSIDLGYRTEDADDSRRLEPIARLTRDGDPVAYAMVFHQLVSIDGAQTDTAEVATVYEAEPSSSGRYLQAAALVPAGTSQCVVRFRILLPESADAWEREVTIELPSA